MKLSINIEGKTMDSKDEVYDEKSAKYCAIGWTIVYLLLFPFLFYVALFSIMVFDNPHMTTPVGLLIIFMSFWVPLSIPVSIYLMWSNYSRGQYKRTHLFWGVPFFTFGIVFILNAILQKLFL